MSSPFVFFAFCFVFETYYLLIYRWLFVLQGIFKVLKKGGIFVATTRSNSIQSYMKQFQDTVNELKNEGIIEIVDEKEFDHYAKLEQTDLKSKVYVFKKLI